MAKKVKLEFEIVQHGLEGDQYFQGCGVSGTDYENVVTGCGNSEQEALIDAIEMMATNHDLELDMSDLEEELDSMNTVDQVETAIEGQLPDLVFRVIHTSSSGIGKVFEEKFESHSDAFNCIMARARSLTKQGFEVRELKSDNVMDVEFEICDPDDAILVSDLSGSLFIKDNEDEIETIKEKLEDNFEARVRVSVRYNLLDKEEDIQNAG